MRCLGPVAESWIVLALKIFGKILLNDDREVSRKRERCGARTYPQATTRPPSIHVIPKDPTDRIRLVPHLTYPFAVSARQGVAARDAEQKAAAIEEAKKAEAAARAAKVSPSLVVARVLLLFLTLAL